MIKILKTVKSFNCFSTPKVLSPKGKGHSKIPTNLLAFIWHFIKQDKFKFILIGILSLSWAFNQVTLPYLSKILIGSITDYSGPKADIFKAIWPILAIWLSFYILIEILFRTLGFLTAYALPKVEFRIRMAMFNYAENHSYSYFADQLSGSLANKINDLVAAVSMIIQRVSYIFISTIAGTIVSLFIFYKLHPFFALITSIWIMLHVGISLANARSCSLASDVHAEQRSLVTGRIVDVFSNIINVKLFSRENYEYKNIGESQEKELKLNINARCYVEWVLVYTGIAYVMFEGFALIFLITYAWQMDWITIEELVMILMLSWNISIMLWVAGTELPNVFKDIGICNQALRILQDEQTVVDMPGVPDLIAGNGLIEFKQVTFGYEKDKLFKNLSVILQSKTKIGLVGFSGSGKSTFVNLIMRFFDLNSGEILIDGQNIKQVTRKSLRENISMIPQQATLFHRSMRDNIKYGKLDATDAEMIAAAKLAHCEEFINLLPQGYDTMVGERGIKLSGGQRQRIAIARAMLKNAPILILDEATSALDSITEHLIQESLDALMIGRTSIVIAHRLSTLQKVDRILVFSNGEIIEDGVHVELMQNPNGHYARMWNMQSGGFLPL